MTPLPSRDELLQLIASDGWLTDMDAEDHCLICKDEMSAPTRTPCGHVFCRECLSTWLENSTTCPICRAELCESPRPHPDDNEIERLADIYELNERDLHSSITTWRADGPRPQSYDPATPVEIYDKSIMLVAITAYLFLRTRSPTSESSFGVTVDARFHELCHSEWVIVLESVQNVLKMRAHWEMSAIGLYKEFGKEWSRIHHNGDPRSFSYGPALPGRSFLQDVKTLMSMVVAKAQRQFHDHMKKDLMASWNMRTHHLGVNFELSDIFSGRMAVNRNAVAFHPAELDTERVVLVDHRRLRPFLLGGVYNAFHDAKDFSSAGQSSLCTKEWGIVIREGERLLG